MRRAVSSETRTSPPLSTLLAVWKLTPARAATSFMETYFRWAITAPVLILRSVSLIARETHHVDYGRTFAHKLNRRAAHGQEGVRGFSSGVVALSADLPHWNLGWRIRARLSCLCTRSSWPICRNRSASESKRP